MSLNRRLEFLRDAMARNAGPEIAAACAQATDNQAKLVTGGGDVLHGAKTVPDVTLVAADGSACAVRDLIAGKPAVLLFFRGDWCPFSATSMRALEEIREDLAAHGVAMVGITPRHHAVLAEAMEKNLLGYPLLTDPKQELTELMGIKSRVIEEMVPLYRKNGVDLMQLNESGEWALPLEATFLVGPDGAICCANAFPHPGHRMEPAEIRARMLEMCEEPVSG